MYHVLDDRLLNADWDGTSKNMQSDLVFLYAYLQNLNRYFLVQGEFNEAEYFKLYANLTKNQVRNDSISTLAYKRYTELKNQFEHILKLKSQEELEKLEDADEFIRLIKELGLEPEIEKFSESEK
ncbi:hypothetical protein [Marinicrinis sediminis]|uniref:Uncharacterized protein n=1 Tax=Marinicrinis sediminis TaxID=1652465 RepID=A0ABW5R994_9BACL